MEAQSASIWFKDLRERERERDNIILLIRTISPVCNHQPHHTWGRRMSESVPPTPIASLNPTLTTFENIAGQCMQAFFTVVRPWDIPPARMRAIVSLSEHLHGIGNSLDPDRVVGLHMRHVTIDEMIRARKESGFVPLFTSTFFPRYSADVTELCSATASIMLLLEY